VIYFTTNMAKKLTKSKTNSRAAASAGKAAKRSPSTDNNAKSAPVKSKVAGKPSGKPNTDPKRVAAILAKLDEAYPEASCELVHEQPFQLLISTILSAQCTDVRVNEVAKMLYPKYPTPEKFAYANPAEMEQDIRPTGFFRNKTKSIMVQARNRRGIRR